MSAFLVLFCVIFGGQFAHFFLFLWQITFLQDAEERLSVVYGLPVDINPEFLKHTDITNRAFLLRLLFNLKRIYFERKDPVRYLRYNFASETTFPQSIVIVLIYYASAALYASSII